MGLLDDVKNAVGQFTAGGGSAQDLTAQFHQMVGSTDPSVLSQGISAALASNQTPPFAQMVSQLFANGSADQRAGMLNTLLGAATPEMQAKLSSLIPGLSGGSITSGLANGVSTDIVHQVAAQMEQHNPGVIDKMGSFYSQHPTLVKSLGTAAMVVAMRKIAEHHG